MHTHAHAYTHAHTININLKKTSLIYVLPSLSSQSIHLSVSYLFPSLVSVVTTSLKSFGKTCSFIYAWLACFALLGIIEAIWWIYKLTKE